MADPYRQYPGPMPGQQSSSSGCCDSCFCFWCSVLTGGTLLLGLGTLFFVAWAHRPMAPIVRLESFTVSDLNLSDSAISGAFRISFEVHNMRYHVYYDTWEVRILYKSNVIGWGYLRKFDQGSMAVDTKSIEFMATSNLLDWNMVSELNSDKSKGSVTFDIEMSAYTVFKFGEKIKSYPWTITEQCSDVPVKFGSGSGDSDGKMSIDLKLCNNELHTRGGWVRLS